MPITATISPVSLTPAQTTRTSGPRPAKVVTGAPFTPKAQKQAAAINTGRVPARGGKVDISV